jgi:hypothetical protein
MALVQPLLLLASVAGIINRMERATGDGGGSSQGSLFSQLLVSTFSAEHFRFVGRQVGMVKAGMK